MNQPTLFEELKCECWQCGCRFQVEGVSSVGPEILHRGQLCPNCENERQRMEEFDALIEADEDMKAAWFYFLCECKLQIKEGAKWLHSMRVLYDVRDKTDFPVSNDHAPMLARKFNAVSGHPYFKLHRLKRRK